MNHGREKAVRFGASGSLVGILTDPAPGSQAADKPAFLMLNSGILHRVGSCRLHVRLARALSAEGFTCLRFDYSGVGDSEQRRDTLSFQEGAVQETREAMDYLRKAKGAQRFVLMGLCSGADMAHETAVVDDRVVGLMLLDGWAYRTVGHHLRHFVYHYGPRLFRWRVWQNFVRTRGRRVLGVGVGRGPKGPAPGVEVEMPQYVRVFPPHERIARDLRTFVQRRIAMYFVWTGGLPEYNHQGQYAASFRGVNFDGLLREEHLADSDHIVTGLQNQERLLENVVGWARALPREKAQGAGAEVAGTSHAA